jgi:hypothetical protein
VFLLLAVLLAGCMPKDISIDDSAFLPGTTAMLDALLTGDYDSCRGLVTKQVEDETLRTAVNQMHQLLADVESYSLKPAGWQKNTNNGITQSLMRYEMQTNAGSFCVDVVLVEGVDGLAGFQITPIQQVDATGTPGSMEGAGILQWLVLLLGFAEAAFVIWMAVDCLRHKFKGRIGWLLMILLISSLISLSFSGGKLSIHFNFGVYLYATALLRESTGAMLLRLHVPVGAIVYWFRRKKLHSLGDEKQPSLQESDGENSAEKPDPLESE